MREYLMTMIARYRRWRKWKAFERTLTPVDLRKNSSPYNRDVLRYIGNGMVTKYEITPKLPTGSIVLAWPYHAHIGEGYIVRYAVDFERYKELNDRNCAVYEVWNVKNHYKLYLCPEETPFVPDSEDMYF